jgi:IS30 family transposase
MQVASTFKKKGMLSISHETIYKHIWKDKSSGGNLYKHLRQGQKNCRKRYNAYDSRGMLAGKRHISERSETIDQRKRVGDWEIDTVMGSGDLHCILTLVERKTGFTLIGKLKDRTKAETDACLLRLIRSYGDKILTITADNGTEFHGYKDIEKRTDIKFYFATPYHSWERGTNENTNGLIRQYLPKRKSMASLTQKKCSRIAQQLNTRPRERHNFKTPLELYQFKQTVALQT